MLRRLHFTLALVLAAASLSLAQTGGCETSQSMSAQQKLACVRAASILIPQPALTPVQLANGPDFNPAEPDKNLYAYFTAASTVSCYFRPHYAFAKVPGDSMKFQCWHMTADGAFYGSGGEVIRANDVKVVIDKDKNSGKNASLYSRDDDKNEHEIKAEHVKIKYLKPPFPEHNPRFNEVFTTVAASRFMWVLGFPADHEYPAGSASCIGCTDDPFGHKLTNNTASLKDPPVAFPVVSVERELSWDEIKSNGDSTWSWTDLAKFYSDGEWTHQQKVEYDAYRLALGLIHYHNALPQQNRIDCAEWMQETSGQNKTCKTPVIYVHDLGSTFGKKRSAFDLFGTNPRGNFNAWQPQTVFLNPSNCELRATLSGDKQVLKEAQDLMIERLSHFNRDTVMSIFRVARFNMVDQQQVRRLRANGSQNVGDAAIAEWTDVVMKRIEEIRTAKNCKAN